MRMMMGVVVVAVVAGHFPRPTAAADRVPTMRNAVRMAANSRRVGVHVEGWLVAPGSEIGVEVVVENALLLLTCWAVVSGQMVNVQPIIL